MWLNKKKIISIFIILFVISISILIFLYMQKKYSEDYLIEDKINNKKSILINEITNFQWDYADLFIVNVDLQKVKFYRDGNIILEKEIVIDSEGELLSQVLFTPKKNDLINSKNQILYYRCYYPNGRLNFVRISEIERSDGNNRYLYFYQPSNCQEVLYKEYLKEFNKSSKP